jgi:hypothetical protein
VKALWATTMFPKNTPGEKRAGGDAMVWTTGTRRTARATRPAQLVRGFGANTKCQMSARDRVQSQAAARALSAKAGA